MQGFLVSFDANDTINGIEVMFYTNDFKTAEAIHKTIKNNLERQFGPPKNFGDTYLKNHRIVMLYYVKDRLKYNNTNSKEHYAAVQGREGEKLWMNHIKKCQYEVSFRLNFPDPRLYHE